MAAKHLPCYEVHVQGHLDPAWSSWLDGLAITHQPDGTTRIRGAVVDQAALYGLIGKVRNLGLTLLAVLPCAPDDQTHEDGPATEDDGPS